jgi:hypothetical protein
MTNRRDRNLSSVIGQPPSALEKTARIDLATRQPLPHNHPMRGPLDRIFC